MSNNIRERIDQAARLFPKTFQYLNGLLEAIHAEQALNRAIEKKQTGLEKWLMRTLKESKTPLVSDFIKNHRLLNNERIKTLRRIPDRIINTSKLKTDLTTAKQSITKIFSSNTRNGMSSLARVLRETVKESMLRISLKNARKKTLDVTDKTTEPDKNTFADLCSDISPAPPAPQTQQIIDNFKLGDELTAWLTHTITEILLQSGYTLPPELYEQIFRILFDVMEMDIKANVQQWFDQTCKQAGHLSPKQTTEQKQEKRRREAGKQRRRPVQISTANPEPINSLLPGASAVVMRKLNPLLYGRVLREYMFGLQFSHLGPAYMIERTSQEIVGKQLYIKKSYKELMQLLSEVRLGPLPKSKVDRLAALPGYIRSAESTVNNLQRGAYIMALIHNDKRNNPSGQISPKEMLRVFALDASSGNILTGPSAELKLSVRYPSVVNTTKPTTSLQRQGAKWAPPSINNIKPWEWIAGAAAGVAGFIWNLGGGQSQGAH
jgi:hypothetical protein